MRFLYVEDDLRDADILARSLRKSAPHFTIDTVHTVNDAIKKLENPDPEQYDLVLTDVNLPDGDGLSILSYVRDRALPCAVVVITGVGDEQTAVAALKAGADDYIVKRNDYIERLPLTMEGALHHFRSSAARRAGPMNVLYVEYDPMAADPTYRHFKEHAPHILLDTVTTGHDALERLEEARGNAFEVVLLGCSITGVGALEFLKELRLAKLGSIPVLLVIEHGSEEVALQALKLGAFSYVLKNPGHLYQLTNDLENAKFVGELARREEALRLSEQRYKLATSAGAVGVWDWNLQSGEFYVDPVLKAILGYEDHEVRNHIDDWTKLIHPLDVDRVMDLTKSYIAGEVRSFEIAHRMVHRENGVRWLLARCNLVKNSEGKVIRLVGTKMDITDRKQAAEALEESEARFAGILDIAEDAIISVDADNRITLFNQGAETIFGYRSEDVIHRSLDILLPARFLEHHQEKIAEGSGSGVGSGLMGQRREVVCRRKDGSEFPAEASISELTLSGQKVFTIILRDISSRKEAEKALRESEQRYRSVVDSQSEMICRYVPDTTLTFVNEAYCRFFGKSRHELVGHKFLDLIPDPAHGAILEHVRSLIENPRVEANEHEVFLSDGSVGWQRWYNYAIRDAEGKIIEFQAIGNDVTDRRKAEEEVVQRDRLLHAMFQSLSSHVIVLDREGVITYASKSWTDPVGANNGLAGAGIGDNYLDGCRKATGDPFAKEAAEGIERVLAGELPNFITEYPHLAGGDERWILVSVDAMPPEHGGVVVSHTDITMRKDTERSLEAALGELRQLKDKLHAENIYLQEAINVAHDFGEIVGSGKALRRVMRQAEQVAPLDTTVLITGETGTGKELLAHAIHNLSPRNGHPLVNVNCATLPAQLIDSELFGHERGAFTGAVAKRVGRFEIANGGTIFLDEIGELPLELQTKLLRVLQEGEFERLGSSRTLKVDVRVLAATNRDLDDAVAKGLFRSDLFYRLSIFPINVPPLRERREDIPMLVAHFVRQLGRKMGKHIESIPNSTMKAMQDYAWPGNIRELRNVVERAAIITRGSELRLLDSLESTPIPQAIDSPIILPPAKPSGGDTLEENQRRLIIQTLEKTYWRVEGATGAAALLGIHPNTLRSRMKKLGIVKPQFKGENALATGRHG